MGFWVHGAGVGWVEGAGLVFDANLVARRCLVHAATFCSSSAQNSRMKFLAVVTSTFDNIRPPALLFRFGDAGGCEAAGFAATVNCEAAVVAPTTGVTDVLPFVSWLDAT